MAGGSLFGIEVTPDGKRVYVPQFTSQRVFGFNIAADGSLSAVPGSPFPFAGQSPRNLVVTPNGAHLIATDTSSKLFTYAIAADGSLSAVGTPVTTGSTPVNLAVTSEGAHLYTSNFSSGNVSAFGVAADGTLSAVGGSPFGGGGSGNEGLAASPDGHGLYVANFNNNNVSGFAINAGGALTAVTGSPFPTGTNPAVESVVVSPDQPPHASLTVSGAGRTTGGTRTFDASASTDPDGTIATYAWDFGDGQADMTTTPTATHTYADGTFTATVAETDNEGCSTSILFTGYTASCNGGAGAAASQQVVVDATVAGPKLKAKKAQRQKGGKVKIAVKAGAAEAVTIKLSGKVTVAGAGKRAKSFKLKRVTK